MSYETILYSVEDRIATITLNRPGKLNAVSDHMIDEIIAALDRADDDDEVRAIVFTGNGRIFCAGADLSAGDKTFDFESQADDPTGTPIGPDGKIDYSHPRVRDGAGRLTLRLYRALKPVIGAIHGAAVGVGSP